MAEGPQGKLPETKGSLGGPPGSSRAAGAREWSRGRPSGGERPTRF